MDCHDSSLIAPNKRIIRRQELDEADNERKKLEGVGEKQEQTVRRLETTAMLLVGSYIYLQSLIFNSLSRMSCEFWWAPLFFNWQDTLMKVFDKAIGSKLETGPFVALGGRVIGDMCGYAAASYLRGVLTSFRF